MLSVIVVTIVSVILSAFFSGMEIAFTSANRLRMEIDRKRGGFVGRIIELFVSKPGEYITTMLVGNNIVLVIYSMYMTKLIHLLAAKMGVPMAEDSVVIETIISTLVIIFFGEFTPKSIFKMRPNAFFRALVLPVYLIYLVLFPLSKLTTAIAFALLRLFGLKVKEEHSIKNFGRIDLENLVDESVENSEKMQPNDIKIFQNALDFSDLRVRDCMVPRVDVEAVELDTSIEELTRRFIDTNFSRLFVWEESIDNIVGYVTTKSLFRKPQSIKEILMPVRYVPEAMETERLMGEMIRTKQSVAVVIDEFGGTAGVISLEDVLEEIVGEIEDEHDTPELVEKVLKDNQWVLSCRLEVAYLNERYDLGLKESDEYDTLAGYIIAKYGSIPTVGTIIESEGKEIKILKSTSSRVELAKVRIL
ncbi:MAG: HlyC/CorC family transporter [Tidjanibacter sp.]|nr:HlyC/CorC family transporter [Tidjanibacter sp.]